MNAANLHVLSNVTNAPQAILEPVSQVRSLVEHVPLKTRSVFLF